MSNISRRKFLKGAGVAALAVAAAGVLAGCSGNNVPGTDVPDVPEVTSKTVYIYFTEATEGALYNKGEGVGAIYEMPVLKDAKVVDPTKIPADKLPEGYELADTTPVEIKNNGNQDFALVPVQKPASSPASKRRVRVLFQNCDTGKKETKDFDIDINATNITAQDVTPPDGWVLANPSWSSAIDMTPQAGYYNTVLPCLCQNA